MQSFKPPKNAMLPHYVRFLIFLSICVVLNVVTQQKVEKAIILTLSFCFGILICLAMQLERFYMYTKGQRLIIKSGVFTKKTAAFSNMRLIYIKQSSPITERLFDITNVSLHGYGIHFLYFPLKREQAERLILLCGVENDV